MNEQRNSNKKNDQDGYKNNNKKKGNNNNRHGRNKQFKNQEHDIILSYAPKPREEKSSEKTIETKDADGNKEIITMKVLDDCSSFQEMIETMKEFNVIAEENELFSDYDYAVGDVTER